MTCKRIDLGGGAAVWSCHRAPPPPRCSACNGANGPLTCHFELSGAKAGQRCGKTLCRDCAGASKPVLRPPHRRMVAVERGHSKLEEFRRRRQP